MGRLRNRLAGTGHAGNDYALKQVQEPSRHGSDSLRFEIRKGDQWEHTFRTEVTTREFARMGSTQWYKFSIFLPSDFPIENNRLVLAQWWAKTKTAWGEVHRSPILHLRFSDGVFSVLLRHYPNQITKDAEAYLQKDLFSSREFKLGTWNSFMFQVKWESSENGFLRAWWNGEQIINYRGITENLDEVGPVFKFGMYRDDSPRTYVAYYTEVEMSESELAQ